MTAKLWPQQQAERIIQAFPDAETYLLQTGFGPSGHPHMGTVGEVVRTHFVAMALAELGKKSVIQVFSDDMDGLRKVPVNIDAPWLTEHLGKPVSAIPDPYGCCASFSAHMNKELCEMLDATGIPYRFVSAAEEYKKGTYNEVLRLALARIEQILNIILPTLREENREGWFPIMPVCAQCGRVNTTRVLSYDAETATVEYSCTEELKGAVGCGHRGVQPVGDGHSKFGWKADWGARWAVFGVHYEMYGKDLIESAKLSKQIVRVLGGRPPVDMFYEMFLDETGRKISKSVGKGLTVENFTRWGTRESLHYLMFKNPRQQKKLSTDTVIQYMDEVLKMTPADPEYRYIYFAGDRPALPIVYSDLINIVSAVGVTDIPVLREFITDVYGPETEKHWDYVQELLEKAINYYTDFILPQRSFPVLTAQENELVDKFLAMIAREKDAEAIQNQTYTIAKEAGVAPRDFFRLLYQVMLGKPSGPRVGTFVAQMGAERIAEIIRRHRASAQ
ncbi:MAG TPA: lysine--tRNA ligase [Bacillota bacterium]|nr:lysine--tRNA ligase [Bacillota bacterium]HQE02600.1 lysine--tRNA ligase [Bacillota bacterium]